MQQKLEVKFYKGLQLQQNKRVFPLMADFKNIRDIIYFSFVYNKIKINFCSPHIMPKKILK